MKKAKQLGFTLVEILLYIAISATLISVVSVFILTSLQSRVKNQVIAEVNSEGVFVSQMISQLIRNAETINSPSTGTSSASLSLNVNDAALDPAVFDLSSSRIRLIEGVSASINLTSSRIIVSNLTFQNLSRSNTPGLIKFSFTLTYINSSGRNEYDFSKTFYATASLR